MRYLIGVMLLMLANVASAVDCQAGGSAWTNVEVNDLRADAIFFGGTVAVEGGRLVTTLGVACRQLGDERVEIWTAYDPVALESRYAHFKTGLKLDGSYYTSPVRSILIGDQLLGNTLVVSRGNPYLTVDSPPNGYIEIPAGAKVLTFRLWIKVFRGAVKIKEVFAQVHVYSRFAINLNPSTCTINNNNPINVDFGSVDPVAIGGDIPAGTPYRQGVTLNYSCPDRGIDSPIDIKLVGAASSFNSSALATTNPNLATGMHRLSALVPPGGSFRTRITNSSGSDTVLFTLFRKPGSFPAAGPFTGSATLVLSVP